MSKRMVNISVRFPSFVLKERERAPGGWVELCKYVADGTTVIQLLSELVESYAGFREGVFNPERGTLTEQIGVVLNDRLLPFTEITATRVGQNDSIVILPIYSGG